MKNVIWDREEIRALREGHIYNDMSDEIKVSTKRLASANAIDEGMAKIIILMLMRCSAYTAVNVSNTRVELVFGSGNADIVNEDCVVISYVCGTKATRIGIDNYLNDLFGYLR